jgi:hypothetical protein
VSIEGDAQKDLEINPNDAENVVGGQKKIAKKQAAQHAGRGSSNAIIINAPPLDPNLAPGNEPVGDDPDC